MELAVTEKKSPGLRRPSRSASVKASVALLPPNGGPSVATGELSRVRSASNFDNDTKAPTDKTSRRVEVVKAIVTGVATEVWFTNIRGRNTTPRRMMKTIPATIEYRRSFVAWGGGLRLRLKTAIGFRGRAIRIDSLHKDRGTPGDGAVAFLRWIPAVRVVGAEHVDLDAQFLRKEMSIFPEHRELVHGAEPV